MGGSGGEWAGALRTEEDRDTQTASNICFLKYRAGGWGGGGEGGVCVSVVWSS